jgi:hypothetical protein
MDPFNSDPLNPFGGGDVPADPMEEVLALQSYETDNTVAPGDDGCPSNKSVVVICPSSASGVG